MPAIKKEHGTDNCVPHTNAAYGRDNPAHEAGQGRLDRNVPIPSDRPDEIEQAVTNRQGPHQINAQDEPNDREKVASQPLEALPDQPDHSLLEEEARGEDLMPQDPPVRRHPRIEGKGGTP